MLCPARQLMILRFSRSAFYSGFAICSLSGTVVVCGTTGFTTATTFALITWHAANTSYAICTDNDINILKVISRYNRMSGIAAITTVSSIPSLSRCIAHKVGNARYITVIIMSITTISSETTSTAVAVFQSQPRCIGY